MEEHVRAYARLRLERAKEELETAWQNLGLGFYRAAVSRAYYAIFYMASAALFTKSVIRSKHSAVEAAFSQFLVKPGEIEPEFSRLYQVIRRQREEADYAEESNIDELSARKSVTDAETFVKRLEQFLIDAGAL